MRVLLFGSTGFLGRAVTRRLLGEGHELTHVVRGSRPGELAGGGGIAFDLGAVGPPPNPGRHDAAVFLAQSRSDREHPAGSVDVVRVSALGMVQALELARRAGVARFLHASSGSVYGLGSGARPEGAPLAGTGVYARTKIFAEELASEWGEWFDVLHLRIFALYGPGQRGRLVANILEAVAGGRPVRIEPRVPGEPCPGGFTTSPCFVEDAAEAVARLLRGGAPGPVNVAGPESVSVRQIAELAGRALGREPRFEVVPTLRAGDLVADIERLRRLTGLEPRGFREGLEATLADPRFRGAGRKSAAPTR